MALFTNIVDNHTYMKLQAVFLTTETQRSLRYTEKIYFFSVNSVVLYFLHYLKTEPQ